MSGHGSRPGSPRRRLRFEHRFRATWGQHAFTTAKKRVFSLSFDFRNSKLCFKEARLISKVVFVTLDIRFFFIRIDIHRIHHIHVLKLFLCERFVISGSTERLIFVNFTQKHKVVIFRFTMTVLG